MSRLPTNAIRIILKHKWRVFRAGLKTKAPLWNLIVHDLSKFSPSEFPHYRRKFCDGVDDPVGFGHCWLHHQNVNPHHWEYWVPRIVPVEAPARPEPLQPLEMPEPFVREMVADWIAASQSHTGSADIRPWLQANLGKMLLHPNTKATLRSVLAEIGVTIRSEFWD